MKLKRREREERRMTREKNDERERKNEQEREKKKGSERERKEKKREFSQGISKYFTEELWVKFHHIF